MMPLDVVSQGKHLEVVSRPFFSSLPVKLHRPACVYSFSDYCILPLALLLLLLPATATAAAATAMATAAAMATATAMVTATATTTTTSSSI